MTYCAGELVELVQAESLGLAGTVPKGTQGVVLRESGLLSRQYLVRLDPAGRQVELPAEALRASGAVGCSGPPLRSSPDPPWWRRRPAHSHRGSRSAAQETPRSKPAPPPASSGWRRAGALAHLAGKLSGQRSRPRRSAGEAVAELKRRLSTPGRASEGRGRQT